MNASHPLDGLLEDLLPKAAELVVAVRDRDPAAVAAVLEPLDTTHLRALLVDVAVMVPDDEQFGDLIAWTHDQDQLAYGELVVGPGEKYCGTCRQVRSVRDFHVDRSRHDSRYPVCKLCRRDRREAKQREAAAATSGEVAA